MLEQPAHGGVTRLVVGDDLFLFGRNDFGLFLESAHDAVYGVEEVLFFHHAFVLAGGHQGGLVAHVGDVGAAESWGLSGQELDVHVFAQFERTQVHLENFNALGDLGKVHIDDAVEAAGAHQGAVQNVGAVGGGHHDDVLVGPKTVHFGEELVERVLALVVAAAERVAAAGPSDGVDLVDEDDARRLFFGLLEQVADPARAHAHKHFDKIGAAQREEGHLGFAGHGLGQQGFTGSRRAAQQHSFGDFAPEVGVFFGIFQKVHDFENLVFGAVEAGHVLEGHLHGVVGVKHLRAALANVENLAAGSARAAAAHAAHQEEPNGGKQQNRHNPGQGLAPVVGFVFVFNVDFGHLGVLGVEALHRAVKRLGGHFKHVVRTLVRGVSQRGLGELGVLVKGRQAVGVDEYVHFFAVHDLDAVDVSALNASTELVKGRRLGLATELALRELKAQKAHKHGYVQPAEIELGKASFGRFARLGAFIFFAHQKLNSFNEVLLGEGNRNRIGPKAFEVIKYAGFALKEVHHHRHVVHENPFRLLRAFDVPRLVVGLFAHPFVHGFSHGVHLGRGLGLGHNKKVAHGVFKSAQVEEYEVLPLNVAHALKGAAHDLGKFGKGCSHSVKLPALQHN